MSFINSKCKDCLYFFPLSNYDYGECKCGHDVIEMQRCDSLFGNPVTEVVKVHPHISEYFGEGCPYFKTFKDAL